MFVVLKYVLIIFVVIILAILVFVGLFVWCVWSLGKGSKTKEYKEKYINCIKQIFGDDMAFYTVSECDEKTALIEFDDRANMKSYWHRDSNFKPQYIGRKGWHQITNEVYAFIDDRLNGSVCSFCHDISSPYFRTMMYLDKEEMLKSHFKKKFMSETGWDLPYDAYVIGYIDYSTQQLAAENVYFCLSECNLDEIKNQLDALVSAAEEWTKDGNSYHFSKSEDGWTTGVSIDYTLGDSFVEVVHFMQ